MSRICRLRTAAGRSERGAELIEFAIAFPLLFLLLAGIIDFGMMFRAYESVTNAAREGARLSVLPGSYKTTDVQDRVAKYIAASGLKATPTTTVTTQAVTLASGARISVNSVYVTYPWPFPIIGSAAKLIGKTWGSITLKAQASMRQEVPAS